MGKVKILDSLVADMIAAGEVVERPASVVKELAENSIDAGAGKITVEIQKGGIELIRVTDDGAGFSSDDLPTAFLRHATSKIYTAEDLYNIRTMGFRGEALASIAAVSKTEVISKQKSDDFGTYLSITAGNIEDVRETGCPDGTTMTVRNLFFNVPARMKFLKKDSSEASAAYDAVVSLALGHPDISFRFISDGKEKLHTPGDGDLKSCIYSVYGAEYAENINELDYKENGIEISGYCGNQNLSRSTRGYQTFFVNDRVFKSRTITYALEQGYQDAIMKGKYPFAVIKININPMLCDVNVHPAKTEVRFSDERLVSSSVYWAVKNAIFRVEKYITPTPAEVPIIKPAISEPEYKFTENKPEIKPPVVYKKTAPTSERSTVQTSIPKQEKPKVYKPQQAEIPAFINETPVQEVFKAPDIPVSDIKIIGQLFGTYIVCEEDGSLVLIDQHAAHERMRFEELLKEKEQNLSIGQTLLSPVVMSFTASEHSEIMDNISAFENLGFDIEDFGDTSIIIRTAPIVSESEAIENVFKDVFDIVCSVGINKARGDAESEALYKIACHGAVRANKIMSESEMKALVRDINKIPPTCPHGRPIKLAITKKDIEKMFKRIV